GAAKDARRDVVSEHASKLLVTKSQSPAEDDVDHFGDLARRADVSATRAALDGHRELACRLVSHAEVSREAARDRFVERGRHVRAELAQSRNRRVHDLVERVDGFFAAKETPPRETLPEHDAEREEIALLRAHAPFVDALGREIRELAL